MTLTFAEHFTGIGGFHLGFERAGMRGTFAGELIPHRQRLIGQHFPHVTIGGDIVSTPGSALGRGLDVLVGGFPCKDTSIAAPNRLGLNGARSGLFWSFQRLLREYLEHVAYTGPRWVIIENPSGILKSNGGRDHAAVVGGLADLGYMGAWRTVDARGVGSPQRRERVLYLGHLGDDPGPAWQVLGDERASDAAHPAHRVRGEAGRPSPVGDASRDGVIFWRKSARPRASLSAGGYETWVESDFTNTLTGFDGGLATRQTHLIAQHGRLRTLTLTEWERIAGFPDDWTAAMPDSERYSALGDSMHPLMAEWLGRRLVAVSAALPFIAPAKV